jgi:hypothetical protein
VNNPQELQKKFEETLGGGVTRTKLQSDKKHIVESSKVRSSDEEEEEKIEPKKPQLIANHMENAPKFEKNKQTLKEKKENAAKINMLVQDDLSFGEGSEESSVDSDEFDDQMSEMRPNGKLGLKKLQTTIPDNLKMDCTPSELLDDFFDDPLEHPLLPNNKFVKHKSEAPRPIGALKSYKSIMEGLGPKVAKDDTAREPAPVRPPVEKMKRLEDSVAIEK